MFNAYFLDTKFKCSHTDTCSTCDLHVIKLEVNPADTKIIKEYENHLKIAETAKNMLYSVMSEAPMSGSVVNVVAMDLQKVLFLPTLTRSKMFYSRQLSVYNLYFHVGDIGNAIICM